MGAATQLHGEIIFTHGQHPHLVAVLLAEQGHGAGRHRLVHGHQAGSHPGIGAYLLVHNGFDGFQLLGGDCPGVGKIKAQALAIHQRAFLRHMVAQYLTQGGVQ